MARRELSRRLGKVRARAGRGPLRPVAAIQIWRPDVDAEWQEAVLAELERAARAELAALGMAPELEVLVGIDDDGVGLAEAGGWRWRLTIEGATAGATAATVTDRTSPTWRA